MARENRLWEWLRDGLRPVRNLHLQRIENSAGLGVPDLEGCWVGHQFWIELKGSNRPVHYDTPIDYKLTRPQAIWLEDRWKCGGRSFLYVRVGASREVKRYLLPGYRAREALEHRSEGWWVFNSIICPEHTPSQLLHAVCRNPKDYE